MYPCVNTLSKCRLFLSDRCSPERFQLVKNDWFIFPNNSPYTGRDGYHLVLDSYYTIARNQVVGASRAVSQCLTENANILLFKRHP